jgi:hypothetical protein
MTLSSPKSLSYFKEDLSIEDYKKLYWDLKNGIRHGDLFCGCPVCLYPEGGKIKKDDYFLAWLLYQSAERKKLKNQKIVLRYKWREAISLMFNISEIKYKIPRKGKTSDRGSYNLKKYKVQIITARHISRIIEAMIKKYKEDFWKSFPEVGLLQRMTDQLRLLKKWKIKEGRQYDNFQRRLFQFIRKERAVTFRELYKHFSGKRSNQILPEITLPVAYRAGWIIGLLRRKIAFYVGNDIPIIQTIDRLQLISKKRGYNDLKPVAQVLEMFSRGQDISRQLYGLSGLKLEKKDKSWIVTVEGKEIIREWPEENFYSVGK